MRIVAISLLALVTLSGCMAVHANIPEDVIRYKAREEGVALSAVCSHEGLSFSEGASVCMANRRMTCDSTERWLQDGTC